MENLDKPQSAIPLKFSQLKVGDEYTVAQVSVFTRNEITVEIPAGTVIKITKVEPYEFTADCGGELGITKFNAEEAEEFLVEETV